MLGRPSKLSPEDKEKILELHRSGMKLGDIGHLFKIGSAWVSVLAKRAGLTRQPKDNAVYGDSTERRNWKSWRPK